MDEVLERAMKRGECPANLDKEYLIDQLFGPIYLRHIVGRGVATQAYIKRLVSDVLERTPIK